MRFKKLICLILILLITMGLTGCMEEAKNIKLNGINLAEIKDGEYIGKCSTNFVKAKVKVIINHHKIVKVDILKHDNGRGEKAEKIINPVVRKQTTKVEVISGATGSSKVILKAIENALIKS